MNNKTLMLAIVGCLTITQNKNIQADFEIKTFPTFLEVESTKQLTVPVSEMKNEKTPTGFKVFIKNDLMYGVAHRDEAGNLKIVNICSSGVKSCEIGKVSKNHTFGALGVTTQAEVTPNVYLSIQEPSKQEPTIITSGGTRVVTGEGDQVNITAIYGDVGVKFRAPVKNTPGPMLFPQDFTMVF